MSSGSAPTVLARMSVVRTSHSLSRFGYCCWELLLREGPPALTAVPPTDLEHPVITTNATIKTSAQARAPLLPCRPGRIEAVISRSRSTDGSVLWLCHTAAGTAFD